jgi:D-aminopeptidase
MVTTDAHRLTPSGKLRARGLGVPFEGDPGPYNAITDVADVAVGYATLIEGEGPLIVGRGPVRTGVTAILPRRRDQLDLPVFAGCFSLNGNGELTGTHWIDECGQFSWPITITNTHACGLARDATLQWAVARLPGRLDDDFGLPVAGETYDGWLNDINGFHIRERHVFDALDAVTGGPIEEGSVGGGTGMICYQFKGGSGTASRRVELDGQDYVIGAFVQANFGRRRELIIAGRPVGRLLDAPLPARRQDGSIIAVIATDAPLLPHQLKRLARRVGLGVGRSGTFSHHGSGDIFLAFSTANADALAAQSGLAGLSFIPDRGLDPLFEAVVQAIDEAIVNSLIANEDMIGRDGHFVPALPREPLMAILRDGAGGAGGTPA